MTDGIAHVVLVFGGRRYCLPDEGKSDADVDAECVRLINALDAAHAKRRIDRLVHGGAPGADKASGGWADLRGVPATVYVVDHAVDGPWPAAGPRRNARMAAAEAANLTGAVGFPGGRGSADMARRLREMGVPTWRPYGE